MKEEKNHVGRPTNEEVKKRKSSKILKFILTILSAVFAFLIFSVVLAKTSVVKINHTKDIKEDKIKITVLGSENVKINDDLSLANGEYTKVKLTIENYGNKTYSWTYNFALDDEMVALNALGQSDMLKQDIESNEKETGYLYFKKTNKSSAKLEYMSNISVDKKGSARASKIKFNIK